MANCLSWQGGLQHLDRLASSAAACSTCPRPHGMYLLRLVSTNWLTCPSLPPLIPSLPLFSADRQPPRRTFASLPSNLSISASRRITHNPDVRATALGAAVRKSSKFLICWFKLVENSSPRRQLVCFL